MLFCQPLCSERAGKPGWRQNGAESRADGPFPSQSGGNPALSLGWDKCVPRALACFDYGAIFTEIMSLIEVFSTLFHDFNQEIKL